MYAQKWYTVVPGWIFSFLTQRPENKEKKELMKFFKLICLCHSLLIDHKLSLEMVFPRSTHNLQVKSNIKCCFSANPEYLNKKTISSVKLKKIYIEEKMICVYLHWCYSSIKWKKPYGKLFQSLQRESTVMCTCFISQWISH